MSKAVEGLVESRFIDIAKKQHREAVVHPLALLSILDHWERGAKGASTRVMGVLLGQRVEGVTHIMNSFGLCFDESQQNKKIWYIDEGYLQTMFRMYKKVNARESIVGWYSTSAKASLSDGDIHRIFCKYCIAPILITIPLPFDPKVNSLQAYIQTQIPHGAIAWQQTFVLINCTTGAEQAEDVAVDYLTRDSEKQIDHTVEGTVCGLLGSLAILDAKIKVLTEYLIDVQNKKKFPNLQILYNIQTIYNSLIDLGDPLLRQALHARYNDTHILAYTAAITRTTTATHRLIKSKIHQREQPLHHL